MQNKNKNSRNLYNILFHFRCVIINVYLKCLLKQFSFFNLVCLFVCAVPLGIFSLKWIAWSYLEDMCRNTCCRAFHSSNVKICLFLGVSKPGFKPDLPPARRTLFNDALIFHFSFCKTFHFHLKFHTLNQ